MPSDMCKKINSTSHVCYMHQDPGVGAGADALARFEKYIGHAVPAEQTYLDVGFGDGRLVNALLDTANAAQVYAADIADACRTLPLRKHARVCAMFLDVSHYKMDKVPDDSVDVAFCTETIEHLSNPYHAVADIKRAVKHGGYFVLSFPMPENNLGYGGGQHAHVYPGFLLRESFERFMMQMYFAKCSREENGASAWYVFKNYKGPGMVDTFEVIAGNYNEEELYSCLRSF
jgi:ubiquinone/menaquinone biosynthesis C-methylase UbiE